LILEFNVSSAAKVYHARKDSNGTFLVGHAQHHGPNLASLAARAPKPFHVPYGATSPASDRRIFEKLPINDFHIPQNRPIMRN
jgi:hypothetical protein